MSCHIAILQQPYLKWILEGKKTIESRFTKVNCAPFGMVKPGERIYLKQAGGPFVASAIAARVYLEDALTPQRVEQIKKQFNKQICGEADFWANKASASKYCTLIWLRDLRVGEEAPPFQKQHMRAWYVLDEAVDPLAAKSEKAGKASSKAITLSRANNKPRTNAESPKSKAKVSGQWQTPVKIRLTAGALRQGYLRLGKHVHDFPRSAMGGLKKEAMGKPIQLDLVDGPKIETDIIETRQMFRSRAWKGWYASQGLSEGDHVLIHQVKIGIYQVSYARGSNEG